MGRFGLTDDDDDPSPIGVWSCIDRVHYASALPGLLDSLKG